MISTITSGNTSATQHARPKPEDIFKKMDSNGDGKLSATEFETAAKTQQAAHAQGAAHAHHGHGGGGGGGGAAGASQAKTYDPADTNKDGTVSAQEAAVYQASQAAKAALSSNAAEAVKTYSGVEASS